MTLSHCPDLIMKVLNLGKELMRRGTSVVMYRNSKENIVFGLARKTLKSNSNPI